MVTMTMTIKDEAEEDVMTKALISSSVAAEGECIHCCSFSSRASH